MTRNGGGGDLMEHLYMGYSQANGLPQESKLLSYMTGRPSVNSLSKNVATPSLDGDIKKNVQPGMGGSLHQSVSQPAFSMTSPYGFNPSYGRLETPSPTLGGKTSPHLIPAAPPGTSNASRRRSPAPIPTPNNHEPTSQSGGLPTYQENVGGTTYYYTRDEAAMGAPSQGETPSLVLPDFTVYPGPPAHVANMKPKASAPSFFLPEELRLELLHQQSLRLAHADAEQFPDLPTEVDDYHQLCPLEPLPSTPVQKSCSFGYVTSVYKATNIKSGGQYCLRRIHGFRLTSTKCMMVVDMWRKLQHSNIVQLRELFTTKVFGDNWAETLMMKHFSAHHPFAMPNGLLAPSSSDPFSEHPRPFPSQGKPGGPLRQHAGLLPESLIWTYIIQLTSALRSIHAANLACRALEPSKILITGKTRLRLNCCGIIDVLAFDASQTNHQALIAHLQQEDLVALGKLVMALACNNLSAIQRENLHSSMEIVARNYSSDLRNLIFHQRVKSINDIMPMIGARFYTQLDAAFMRCDVIESETAKEVENGRLFRLLVKLNTVNERPELNLDPAWSETGDRYLLKLFRDYVFHQVTEDGRPWLDLAHIVQCLNKLDAGVPEKDSERIQHAAKTAEEFIRLYYECIDRKRHMISKLYMDQNAVLIWNGNSVMGKDEIQKFFQEQLPPSRHTFYSLDAHPVSVYGQRQMEDHDIVLLSSDDELSEGVQSSSHVKGKKKKVVHDRELTCLSCSCEQPKLKLAELFVQVFYGYPVHPPEKLKKRKVCGACWDRAKEAYSEIQDIIKKGEPFYENKKVLESRPIVTLSDSESGSDEEVSEPRKPSESQRQLIQEQYEKSGLKAYMEQQLENLHMVQEENETDFNEIERQAQSIQKDLDEIRASIYEGWGPNYHLVEEIVIEDDDFEIARSQIEAHVDELDSEKKKYEPPKFKLPTHMQDALSSSLSWSASTPSSGKLYLQGKEQSSQANELPDIIHEKDVKPMDALKCVNVGAPLEKPELHSGMEVFVAERSNICAPWTLVSILDGPHPSVRDGPVFRVRSKRHKRVNSFMPSKKYMAYSFISNQGFPIGTRVIANYRHEEDKEKTLSTMPKIKTFYAGIVGEIPKSINRYRYLIFFDDSYTQYVPHEEVRLVCDASENVWEDVHFSTRPFIRAYLSKYPEQVTVKLKKDQHVKVELDGKWRMARVLEVDASLAKLAYTSDDFTEWIYRGSARLAAMHNHLVEQQTHSKGSRHRHDVLRASQKNRDAPFIEYNIQTETGDEAEDGQKVRRQVARKHGSGIRQTARKTGSAVGVGERSDSDDFELPLALSKEYEGELV
ncbi:unnamed protein product, partial [Darwinula stevensoni]